MFEFFSDVYGDEGGFLLGRLFGSRENGGKGEEKMGTGRRGRIGSTNIQEFSSYLSAALFSRSNEGVEYVRTFLIPVSPLYEIFLVHELILDFVC